MTCANTGAAAAPPVRYLWDGASMRTATTTFGSLIGAIPTNDALVTSV